MFAPYRASNGRTRAVITGVGALTPLGLTAEDTWRELLAGRSGIDRIELPGLDDCPCKIAGELKGFDPRNYLDRKDSKRMARFSQLAVIATQMALDDSKLEVDAEEREHVGVVTGTAVGGTVIEVEGGLRGLGERSLMRVSPNHLLALPPNMGSFQYCPVLWLSRVQQHNGHGLRRWCAGHRRCRRGHSQWSRQGDDYRWQ